MSDSESVSNFLHGFEEELQDFYQQVLFKMNINEIRALFAQTKITISVDQKKTLNPQMSKAVYLFKYGSFCSSAVANHLLRMVDKNPLIFKNILLKKEVKMCCLGGGSGSEVVAFCKVLSAQQWPWFVTEEPLHLEVTIVDKSQVWKRIADKVFQILQKTSCMFDESKITMSFQFIKADLTKPMDTDVKKALGEADVVTMVKLISAIKLQTPPVDIKSLIQGIVTFMKNDAVLFYLDSGKNRLLKFIHSSLKPLKDVHPIYGPVELEPFMLSLGAVQKYIELFYKDFNRKLCLTSTIINSSAWIKSPILAIDEMGRPGVPLTAKQFEDQAEYCDKTLAIFHEKVTRILPEKKKFQRAELREGNSPLGHSSIKDKGLFQSKNKDKRISF